jgi:hypothetical protein
MNTTDTFQPVCNDPRGREYGHYHINPQVNGAIRVSWFSASGEAHNFAMEFQDMESFNRWASQQGIAR